jgi:hypothetical protein
MTDLIVPDAVWCDKGEGNQRIRIVDTRRDGRIIMERIAGVPDYAQRREVTVTEWQLRQAFKPTDEWDFGPPAPSPVHCAITQTNTPDDDGVPF